MLAGRFQATVVFIHVGVPLPEQMKIFANFLEKNGFKNQEYKMVFREGDVQRVIWDVCAEFNVDLLVSGALRKESPERQYFGSIARGLAGNPKGPIMLIPEATLPAKPIDTIIATLSTENKDQDIQKILDIARQTGCSTLYFVKESVFKADPLSLADYNEKDGFGDAYMMILDIEYALLHEKIRAYNFDRLNVKVKVVYGLPGTGVVSFAKNIGADLIIDSLQTDNLNDDNLGYPGGIEVVLRNLPCNYLLFN